MRLSRFGLACWLLIVPFLVSNARAQAPTAGPRLLDAAGEARVRPLLGQMTLDEKIGQMVQAALGALPDRADITRLALGSVLCGGNSDPPEGNRPEHWAAVHDDCMKRSLESRLKVPILFGVDAVHGHNNVLGAVIFPHNAGLGATRNPELVKRAARVPAREIAATGIRWTFAPCVAVARNERWGRTYESFGESPQLVSLLGAAAVEGFQGGRLHDDPTSVLACAKHFMGDGGTTGGKDQGLTEGDEDALEAIHLTPYEAAVKAGAGSVMISYSSWNGTKMHAQKRLIRDVLEGRLGFQGLVVSDWAAIDQIDPDYGAAVEKAINAGLDLVMIPNGPGKKNSYVDFIRLLKAHVEAGRVPMARIDDAVTRVLRVKAAMGLLDHPALSDASLLKEIGSKEHREVARQCVRESLVLLKNEGKALPLSRELKHLVVIGKAADDLGVQCGGWTIAWQGARGEVTPGGTTLLAAVKQAVGSGTKVTYSADGSNLEGADAIVVAIGEAPYAEMMGDRADLSVSPEDRALVAKARASGKPVITVLYSGRPLILGPALDDSSALVAAWLPGTEGEGITDVLFGAHSFKGKLPHTWPRSMDQVPLNEGEPMKGEPLFPFGFGLTD